LPKPHDPAAFHKKLCVLGELGGLPLNLEPSSTIIVFHLQGFMQVHKSGLSGRRHKLEAYVTFSQAGSMCYNAFVAAAPMSPELPKYRGHEKTEKALPPTLSQTMMM